QVADDVPPLAVDLDEIPTLGEVVDHGLFQIQLAAQLIKVRHFQLGAMLDGAAGGLKLTEHQFQQGTLAGAVVADQADTVPTNDVGGKTAHQRPLARPSKADLVQLDNTFARGVGSFHLEAGLALPLDTPRAFVPHRLERADPTLVTGTAGLDALANPDLFLGQLLIEQGVGRRFGGQLLLLVFKEAAVVALPVDQLTTVELHDAGGQRLQELTVVGNEQHGTAELQQHLL